MKMKGFLITWAPVLLVLAGCSGAGGPALRTSNLATRHEVAVVAHSQGANSVRRSKQLAARTKIREEKVGEERSSLKDETSVKKLLSGADDAKPWPAKDTPEWKKQQAEQDRTEEKLKKVMRICGNC